MMKKSGYLYFYDDNGEYSRILHLSVLCASIIFEKVYLCVSSGYYNFFKSRLRLPENVKISLVNTESLKSSLIQRLDSLYLSGTLRSNCPPVERHCINRWLHLDQHELFGETSLFSFDWDTLIFRGLALYEPYLEDVDLAATNLMTLGWVGAPDEPIWSLCPNLLYFSKRSLKYYVTYLEKYIEYSEKYGSVVDKLFCDMQPWSSVISTSLVGKSNLCMLNLNDLVSQGFPIVDHNVRVLKDCGIIFRDMHYYFQPGSPTYLDKPYLSAKQIVFSDNEIPYFVVQQKQSLNKNNNAEIKPLITEAAAIHFSGVEGKHLLQQTFIDNLIRYLTYNIDRTYLTIL